MMNVDFATEIIPGMGLDKVFGVRESKVEMQDNFKMEITSSQKLIPSLKKNQHLKGTRFAESFEVYENGQTEVIATLEDKSPCIVSNKYGNGKTLIIGTFLGMANHQQPDKNNNQFLLNLG